ncbi:proline racemase family protein [Paraburkholderia youngii]|uniref:proline racemase family protein n=1 Tax=Paraburkholderia youngii TaxID=2782701 RepID=UPI003D1A9E97
MRWNRTFTMVGCHAEGEVGNVITGGLIDVPGNTMFDKMIYLEEHGDEFRKICLFEPRGSVNHNVNFIPPATDPRAQMGYVIGESTEYVAMSGSNTICVATVLLETGILRMHEPVTELVLEAPAGLIHARCECSNGKVMRIEFTNQPAFVANLDAEIEVKGLGSIKIDVAYGGMTYALVDAQSLGFSITSDEARELCELGQKIKAAAVEQLPFSHPLNPLIKGVTNTQFMGPLKRENGKLLARNTVIVSPGRCDRSPCGTGTAARLGVLHARGLIDVGETFIHESITGSRFDSRVASTMRVGNYDAIVPVVSGQAWITSISQVGVDPTDRFQAGFTLADTWLDAVDNKLIKSRKETAG